MSDLIGRECGAPNALQTFTRAVEGDQFSFLQERWEVPTRQAHDFEIPLVSDAELDDRLHAFIHSSSSNIPLQMPPSSTTLAPEDHEKFLSRTSILARQINPSLASTNIAALASTFHVVRGNENDPRQQIGGRANFDQGWNVGPHEEAFENAWGGGVQQQQQQQHSEWLNEFNSFPQVQQHEEFETAWQNANPTASTTTTTTLDSAWNESSSTTTTSTASEIEAVRVTAKGIVSKVEGQQQGSTIGNTRFMNFMRQLGSGALQLQGNTIVQGNGTSTSSNTTVPLPINEANLREAMGGENEAADQNWADEFENQTQQLQPHEVISEATLRAAGEYTFAPTEMNPFVSHAKPLEKAVELISNGQTTQAILALEATVMKEPLNSKAWRLLGIAHAEGDDDARAIAALNASRRIDPGDPQTLIALAVSFANDLHKDEAIEAMREWLRLHPRYHSIPIPQLDSAIERQVLTDEPNALQDPGFREMMAKFTKSAQTLAMFNSAASSTSNSEIDADVQIALGLLYNLSYEYERAAERFQTALSIRPQDPLLWNKLGATLANSNKNDQAVQAYKHALELRPGYVRAHSNLGIAMLALRNPLEGAKEFLRALEISGDGSADHIWDNLALALKLMGRDDLVSKIDLRNPDFFRSDIDF